MERQNGAQHMWTLDIYEKDQRSKKSIDVLQICESKKVFKLEVENCHILQLQSSRLLAFGHDLIPLELTLPTNMNDPETEFHETIHSDIVAVGNEIEIVRKCKGNEEALCGALRANAPQQRLPLVTWSGIMISLIESEEDDCKPYLRRSERITKQTIAGLRQINSCLKNNGINAEMILEWLMKENDRSVKVKVKLLYGKSLAKLEIQQSAGNFLTISHGTWMNDIHQATGPQTGNINTHYCKSGTSIQPGFRHTEIFSNATLIGDKGKITVGKAHSHQSEDVTFKWLSFLNAPSIKSVGGYIKLLITPNALSPTGVISTPKHMQHIAYCNSLRKRGEYKQLNAMLGRSIARYGNNPDAMLSYGLSRAFAMISLDTSKAEKYLNKLPKLAFQARNSALFLGKIHLYKGYIALLKKEYEVSHEELDAATDHLQTYKAGEVKAWLCYLKAVLYKIFAEQHKNSPSIDYEEMSLKYFKLYLQHVKIKEKDGFFAHSGVNCVLLKMAYVCLLIYEKVDKNSKIATSALTEARHLVSFIENAKEDNEALKSVKAGISKKESNFQGIEYFTASMRCCKENPEFDRKAAKELKIQTASFNSG